MGKLDRVLFDEEKLKTRLMGNFFKYSSESYQITLQYFRP
jgi:hypothetical protein